MTHARRATTRRGLHPLAWWIWAAALAAGAMRMTNPLLLGLVLAVVAYVVAARKSDAPWAGSFRFFLRLGVFVIALRMLLEILFGARLPGTVLFSLPSVDLPDWAAGVSLGGPVTVEMVLDGFTQGLRLAVVLACFGAANTLASPYRLLRSLPAVLYEAGVVVTVALSFAPQVVMSVGRRREARRLRGRNAKGLRAWRGLAMPVLEGSLDRSVALAASMDARGYGRHADLSPSARRTATLSTALGLLAVCGGVYGLLDSGAPAALGLPLLGAGALVCAVGLVAKGRRTPRTRYRPDVWGTPEWSTVLSGGMALAGIVVAARIDPASVRMPLYPLEWPAVPMVAVAGSLLAVLPAFVAPRPGGVGARSVAATTTSVAAMPAPVEASA
jgi:energy-coupling factor transport system permease protein